MDLNLATLRSLWMKAFRNTSDFEKPVGCLIVGKKKNYFGCNVTEEGEPLLSDKSNIVHAEIDAIGKAEYDCVGATLYVTKTPCLRCASQIVSSGIARVITPKPYINSQWYESQHEALKYLESKGKYVELVDFDDREEMEAYQRKVELLKEMVSITEGHYDD